MKIAYLPVILVSFLLVGCESTPHYNRTKMVTFTEPQPKKPYGSVKLYESPTEVEKAYDVIAKLSVEGQAGEEALFIKAFLYRAADLGGDALILHRMSMTAGVEGGGWAAGTKGGFGMPYTTKHKAVYMGDVITYR